MADERQSLDSCTPWWGEHVHRYETVLPYLRAGDRVLDIACGTGYGTAELSKHVGPSGAIIGGDLSKEAIDACSTQWSTLPQAKFQVMDGTALPFENDSFDRVVSFETIEHTPKYEQILQEFRRVLKPGGLAFISTPNRPVNSPGGMVTNPFHTQEFDYSEFTILMSRHYPGCTISGQSYSRYAGPATVRGAAASVVENLLYRRGIRKLPLSLQDKIMGAVRGGPLYPEPHDFTWVSDERSIRTCKTFFALCKK